MRSTKTDLKLFPKFLFNLGVFYMYIQPELVEFPPANETPGSFPDRWAALVTF